ncbi:MAG: nitrite reductase, copper-containing [Alphaproteobacteria bacterium]|nr:MAG: nitrite reductase, copper-containing [Alphaproteobacteria bacterium]
MANSNEKKSFKRAFNDAARSIFKRPAKIVATAALGLTLGMGSLAADVSAQTAQTVQPPAAVSIVLPPTDLPPPIAERPPQNVEVVLETVEVKGQLDDGTTYNYWTFGGKVPGPLVRVREGDTVHVTLKNAASSMMMHNIDFHAVTGPGGGAGATEAMPGKSGDFTFKALHPGIYVYHCATPPVAWHIAKGMYGMILVEPKEGLKPVDREFYVMQGEIYTAEAQGTRGAVNDDYQKLMNETPEYYVFNGAVGALVKDAPLKAKVGETIRIYFGDAGPNKTSSFHIIGETFDKVYELGSLTSPPLTDVQTITVPPGGATMVELKLEVPGKFMLVDHALSRAGRGLLGVLEVEGPENTEVFKAAPPTKPPSMKH